MLGTDCSPKLPFALLRERAFGADHPSVGHTLHMLAKLYRQAGRREEADELANRAVEILGREHPEGSDLQ